MVILDTTETDNNEKKGILYLSILDIEYLITKYSKQELKSKISIKYLNTFYEEIEKMQKEDPFSTQYYLMLQLEIKNRRDDGLLKLIKKEVQDGNLYTKKGLKSLNYKEVDIYISILKAKNSATEKFCGEKLTTEELYVLKSLQMYKHIIERMERAAELLKLMQEGHETPNIYNEYTAIIKNLESMTILTSIVESDYFENQIELKKILS